MHTSVSINKILGWPWRHSEFVEALQVILLQSQQSYMLYKIVKFILSTQRDIVKKQHLLTRGLMSHIRLINCSIKLLSKAFFTQMTSFQKLYNNREDAIEDVGMERLVGLNKSRKCIKNEIKNESGTLLATCYWWIRFVRDRSDFVEMYKVVFTDEGIPSLWMCAIKCTCRWIKDIVPVKLGRFYFTSATVPFNLSSLSIFWTVVEWIYW